MFIINWYIGLYHSLMYHISNNPGRDYWFYVVMPGFLIVAAMILFSLLLSDEFLYPTREMTSGETWAASIRGFVVGVLVDLAWPWLLIGIAPLAVLFVVFVIVWSFWKLVPSKEERIARAESKVRDAKGRLVETR